MDRYGVSSSRMQDKIVETSNDFLRWFPSDAFGIANHKFII